MKVCEQLKINLGELFYLQEQLHGISVDDNYDLAVSTRKQTQELIMETSELLQWTQKAKRELIRFIAGYFSEIKFAGAKNTFGDIGGWSEVVKKYCHIDHENKRIYINKDIDFSGLDIFLPKSLAIKGNLNLGSSMNSLPDDLIIEGDVLAHNNEKLHLQLLVH